CSCKENGF
ncbi:hypothetical protein CP8484711_0980B, partial [Chlamydia psittaci 84-8471/1]